MEAWGARRSRKKKVGGGVSVCVCGCRCNGGKGERVGAEEWKGMPDS